MRPPRHYVRGPGSDRPRQAPTPMVVCAGAASVRPPPPSARVLSGGRAGAQTRRNEMVAARLGMFFARAGRMLLYLAQLTHRTGSQNQNRHFPLAIGYLGTYIRQVFGERVEVRLFKHVHLLDA